MDEVDKIIIHSLRQIGCVFDAEVSSLTNFTPELLVNAVAACLQETKPSAVIPKSLPEGMTQRFSVATTLAEACAAAGYRNDIGYQTFLYPNVVDVRKLFMFLIEILPKERGETIESSVDGIDSGGDFARLQRDIRTNILESLHAPWVPAYCRQHISRRSMQATPHYVGFKPHLNLRIPKGPQDVTDSQMQHLAPSIFQQMAMGNYDIISSVLHKHDVDSFQTKAMHDHYEFSKTETSQNAAEAKATTTKTEGAPDNYADNLPVLKIQTPLEQVNDQLDALKRENDELNLKKKLHSSKINELKSLQTSVQQRIAEMRRLTKMHERTCVVLEEPTQNVDKLKGLIEAAQEKRRALEQQWQEYRTPLVQRLQALQSAKPSNNMSKNVFDLRELIGQLELNLEEKSATHSQLSAELKRPNRSTAAPRKEYTRRIMEFIGNIRKQRNDIFKVLDDTRDLQKQINTVSAQLQRQFNYTDDLLFKSAKHDAHSRRAYKFLAALHDACNELVKLVSQTGNVTKEIRDLEESIDRERVKNIAVNLEKISVDIRSFENVVQSIQAKILEVENRITEG